jgi:hypothetical protein
MNLETEAFNNGADHYMIIVVTGKSKMRKKHYFSEVGGG